MPEPTLPQFAAALAVKDAEIERLRKALEKVLEFESRYHEWLWGKSPFQHEEADRLHDIMLRQVRQALEQKP